MTSALKASTYETYGSAWRSWENYCAAVNINTWAADVWQGADYLHWLADRGKEVGFHYFAISTFLISWSISWTNGSQSEPEHVPARARINFP